MTNGSCLLPGIDGRSPTARRYRDLVLAYLAELGGEEAVTEATRAMVRQAAGIAVQSEQLQASIVNGEPVDAEQLVRVSNLLNRSLKALGIGQGKAQAKPKTLAEHLAERGAAA